MVKATRILTAAVFGLALTIVIAGFVPVSHPAITRRVLAGLRQAGFDSCVIGSAKAAVWKGMTVRDVYCSGPFVTGRCTVTAETVVLSGTMLPLLLARKKPGAPPAVAAGPHPSPLSDFYHVCRSAGSFFSGADVSSAQAVISEKKRPSLLLRGCSMKCVFSGNGCRGSFSAESLSYAAAPAVRRLKTDFFIDSTMVRLSGCNGTFSGGTLKCGGRLDLHRGILGAFTLAIRGFDIDEWQRYAGTSHGRYSGKADCVLSLDSSSLAVDSLRGRGSATAARFKVSGTPLQRTLASVFGYPAFTCLRFRKFTASFSVAPGGNVTTEAAGTGDSLSIKASGWFTTAGSLQQKIECTVSRTAVRTLPPFAREMLEETADGGRVLRLRIYGTFENPKFTIENTSVLRNVFDDVSKDIRELFR